MKKLLLLCFAIVVASIANADNPSTKPPKGQPIPINPKPVIPLPLSLYADIEASYYDGVVTLVVNRDLGVADIVVVNMTSGDQWSDTILGVGTTSIILDGESGEYYIYIYTDCGDYSGTFII